MVWSGSKAASATSWRRVCTPTGRACKDVRVEVVDARQVRFEHEDLKVITRTAAAHRLLDICTVERNCAGVLFIDGDYVDTLAPGLYAFWKDAAEAKLVEIDLRETTVDVSGQEIMTADKVSCV